MQVPQAARPGQGPGPTGGLDAGKAGRAMAVQANRSSGWLGPPSPPLTLSRSAASPSQAPGAIT